MLKDFQVETYAGYKKICGETLVNPDMLKLYTETYAAEMKIEVDQYGQ